LHLVKNWKNAICQLLQGKWHGIERALVIEFHEAGAAGVSFRTCGIDDV
jgi:hypothetical protein